VLFERKVNPAQYEDAMAEVRYSFVVEDGEDAGAVSAGALDLARSQVLAAVGRKPVAEATPAKPPRGRKPAAKKADEKPAEEKPAEEKPAAAKDPMADDPPRADTKGGVVPAEEVDDALNLNTTEAEVEEISDSALQEAVKKQAARLTGRVVKQVMEAEFGVKQLGALVKEKRGEFIAKLEGMKAE
jgi:hypothetical protein